MIILSKSCGIYLKKNNNFHSNIKKKQQKLLLVPTEISSSRPMEDQSHEKTAQTSEEPTIKS